MSYFHFQSHTTEGGSGFCVLHDNEMMNWIWEKSSQDTQGKSRAPAGGGWKEEAGRSESPNHLFNLELIIYCSADISGLDTSIVGDSSQKQIHFSVQKMKRKGRKQQL